MSEVREAFGARMRSIGAVDQVKRESGQELFDSLSKAEQDELLGPEKAQLVRDGTVELSDLVQRNPQDEGPDFITSKPLQDLDT